MLPACGAVLWAIPFAWMAVASLRPSAAGLADIASLTPSGPFDLSNFRDAWSSGHFPLWYLNTVLLCGGILAVQVRDRQPGRLRLRAAALSAGAGCCSPAFLLQLMLVPPILIVPNMRTLVALTCTTRCPA